MNKILKSIFLKCMFFNVLFYFLNSLGVSCQSSNKDTPPKSKIALIYMEDPINHASPYLNALEQAARPEYKGILLYIDNVSGGISGTADFLFLELKKIQKTKPIVVIIENTCFSAAYHVACGADLIIASPGSEIGSIGNRFTFNRAPEAAKENTISLYAGKYKAAGDPNVPFTEENKEYFLNLLKEDHNRFKQLVALERGLSLEKSESWGEGQIFNAPRAKEMKLIDDLGCYSDAVEALQRLITKKENTHQQFDIITIPLEIIQKISE